MPILILFFALISSSALASEPAPRRPADQVWGTRDVNPNPAPPPVMAPQPVQPQILVVPPVLAPGARPRPPVVVQPGTGGVVDLRERP